MKLAEALKLRADLNTRLYQLQDRLSNNSKVQEGEEPSEDPMDLLRELESTASQLEDLISRINLTNSRTVSKGGVTLTELIARRDVLTRRVEIMRTFLDEASRKVSRGATSDIRVVSTVDVRELRKVVDELSHLVRTTDVTIQELNWSTELV